MKIDGETGTQLAVTVVVVLVVIALVFRWKMLRGAVTGIKTASDLG